ncbi:MAG: HPr(Ser) kinase/phosphatase [Clostridia bacterium]|jgi:HPr kinase/phosphorylase|nr:HPr(Ser) kinase/phosphatase [Clostridia bacterium]
MKRENIDNLLQNTDNSSDWTDSYLRLQLEKSGNLNEPLYSVPLSDVIKAFDLEILHMPENCNVKVTCRDVNRPGLPLAGFFDHFEAQRIQIIGKVEHLYLQTLDEETRNQQIYDFISKKPVAVIFSTSLSVFENTLQYAKEFGVPVLRTSRPTSEFMAALISYLNTSLAPRITRHGVLVEIYGEGVLMLGDSGIGKSETAIEIVKRGHRLIADDAVEIKKVSDSTLIGTAPEIIRHYIELRGIGIVDIRRLFGMSAVKVDQQIDLVVSFETWNDSAMYDRFGLETETIDIMGVTLPKYTIPVSPGRNLAVILEIAAMNQRQKKMGYNTAEEFNQKLLDSMSE